MKKRIRCLSALLFAFLLGCADLIVQQPELDFSVADFEAVSEIVGGNYAFLEFKRINWDSIHSAYRPRAERAKGDQIYPLLHEVLAQLKDGHVEIRTEGGFPVVTYDWPRRLKGYQSYSPLVVRKYFDQELRLAGERKIEFGELPSGIGYVYLSSFSKGSWITEFDEVLADLRDTRALIVDVRNNSGGSSATVDFVVGRFCPSEIRYSFFHADGRVAKSSTIAPRGPFQYRKPVVVLINGVSFSAAELFVEVMKQIPTVVTVGDTTGGGGGGNRVFDLPSGKRIKIPVTYFTRFNGDMVEWYGIPPDVRVAQTKEDVERGQDKQLERAIQLLQSPNSSSEPSWRDHEDLRSRDPEIPGGHERKDPLRPQVKR